MIFNPEKTYTQSCQLSKKNSIYLIEKSTPNPDFPKIHLNLFNLQIMQNYHN